MNAAIWISLLMVICGLIALKQWLNGDLFSL
jgi:hypothetical protein